MNICARQQLIEYVKVSFSCTAISNSSLWTKFNRFSSDLRRIPVAIFTFSSISERSRRFKSQLNWSKKKGNRNVCQTLLTIIDVRRQRIAFEVQFNIEEGSLRKRIFQDFPISIPLHKLLTNRLELQLTGSDALPKASSNTSALQIRCLNIRVAPSSFASYRNPSDCVDTDRCFFRFVLLPVALSERSRPFACVLRNQLLSLTCPFNCT